MGRIEIPGSVTSIGNSAFYASSLGSIEIAEGVTSIGDSAFQGCINEKLTSIHLPDSITSIGSQAFRGCFELRSVNIPKNVTYLGEAAFAGCPNLTIIQFPESLTQISAFMFDSCYNLREVHIPASVTDIGEKAIWSYGQGFKIYCHPNSYAHAYALEHGYRFALYGVVIVKTDEDTGIRVSADSGVILDDTSLHVRQIKEGDLFEIAKRSLSDISSTFTLLEINLLQDGSRTQPDGSMTVSIPVPADYNECQVYRLDEYGEKNNMSIISRDGYLEFETDSFGLYAVAGYATIPVREKGDVDGDGNIKLSDAQMALRAALNIISLSEEELWAADVNDDQSISLGDAQKILRVALNVEAF